MNKIASTVAISVIALVLGACGPGASPSAAPAAAASAASGVTISTSDVSGLGTVLVDAQGRTLYVFAPDAHSKVTCTGDCAKVWPPLTVPSGGKPVASGKVNASLLGTAADPAGGDVATYAGWPLYTYVGDTSAGQHNGQALNLNGGLWYVISSDGTVLEKKP